jgi:hypothetical protein
VTTRDEGVLVLDPPFLTEEVDRRFVETRPGRIRRRRREVRARWLVADHQ